MAWEKEINSVFINEENKLIAQKVVDTLHNKLENITITCTKVPDIRLKVNSRVFFRMKKSCATDFFLVRDAEYPLLNKTTDSSQHTHTISGDKIKTLNNYDMQKIIQYIEEAYHKHK